MNEELKTEEIITISGKYHNLSAERKKNLIDLLKQWIKSEEDAGFPERPGIAPSDITMSMKSVE